MRKIYLCEDEKIQRTRIRRLIEACPEFMAGGMEIAGSSGDPRELLALVRPGEAGIYFLDIELKNDMDGLQLAEEIRRIDDEASLIFVTTHGEWIRRPYELCLETMSYIIKEGSEEEKRQQISRCLQRALEKTNRSDRQPEQEQACFELITPAGVRLIPYDQILYFETLLGKSHRIRLVTGQGSEEYGGSIEELEQKLQDQPRFWRCHRGAIVNLSKIRELDARAGVFRLDQDRTCPVSQKNIRSYKKNH